MKKLLIIALVCLAAVAAQASTNTFVFAAAEITIDTNDLALISGRITLKTGVTNPIALATVPTFTNEASTNVFYKMISINNKATGFSISIVEERAWMDANLAEPGKVTLFEGPSAIAWRDRKYHLYAAPM